MEDNSEKKSPSSGRLHQISCNLENQTNENEEFTIEGENEPYLGPSWAVLMLVLYALKSIFPAQQYSPFWWFQIYIVAIVLGITIFSLIKRYIYFNSK
jgi:hypothetical protein